MQAAVATDMGGSIAEHGLRIDPVDLMVIAIPIWPNRDRQQQPRIRRDRQPTLPIVVFRAE
eukprot:SAG31_NODE_37101_length_307_cov_0.769231_1_plen_60_part_10